MGSPVGSASSEISSWQAWVCVGATVEYWAQLFVNKMDRPVLGLCWDPRYFYVPSNRSKRTRLAELALLGLQLCAAGS